jgi:hypothetical protein
MFDSWLGSEPEQRVVGPFEIDPLPNSASMKNAWPTASPLASHFTLPFLMRSDLSKSMKQLLLLGGYWLSTWAVDRFGVILES